MKAFLFILLLSLLNGNFLFAQPPIATSNFSPLHSLEFALTSVESSEHPPYREHIFNVLQDLKKEQKITFPAFIHRLEDLYLLSQKEQEAIIIPLVKALKANPQYELFSFQALTVFTHQFPHNTEGKNLLKEFYQKGSPNGQQTPSITEKDLIELEEVSKKFQEIIFSKESLQAIPIYNGFEYINSQKIPEPIETLKSQLDKAKILFEELKEKTKQVIESIGSKGEITNYDEFKRYVDVSKLTVGGKDHPLGKAKNTFVMMEKNDGQLHPVLISRVVLHDSENAYVFTPDYLDIKGEGMSKYLLTQHAKAGTTYMGFKDFEVLNDPYVNKNTPACLMDFCYGTPHSKLRLEKNFAYWKARFKKVYQTGRNLYIIQGDKVTYSPRASVYDPQAWRNGEIIKRFQKIIWEKGSDWKFAGLWGGFNGVTSYFISTKFAGEPALESFIFASSIALAATYWTAHTSFLQNATKNFSPFMERFHNLLLTSATFAIVYLTAKYFFLGDITATLNIFGENALYAWQNIYNVFIIGVISKYFSETWKKGTDAIKSAKVLKGKFHIWGITIPHFKLLYQGLQFVRGTIKNFVLLLALNGGNLTILGFEIEPLIFNDFAFITPSLYILPLNLVLGAIVSYYGIIKGMKLLEKSPKVLQTIHSNTAITMIHNFDTSLRNIKKNLKKLKSKLQNCNLNFLKKNVN